MSRGGEYEYDQADAVGQAFQTYIVPRLLNAAAFPQIERIAEHYRALNGEFEEFDLSPAAELAAAELAERDRFAREGLYDLLQHVPDGVEIKVMTTDRVNGGGYQQRVTQFAQQHPDIEVRYLSDSDWDFHDRYVIRDREDGWAWGHSFHDAGDTQHTASELRPINRESIESQFSAAWQDGTVVV